MRFFAALYFLAVCVASQLLIDQEQLLPRVVCIAAAMLAGFTVVDRPLVLGCAAHAGLTATWAGTLAARHFHPSGDGASNPATLGLLLMMCAGMAVLVIGGLKSAQRAAAQRYPRR
jgi:hypothetical protein